LQVTAEGVERLEQFAALSDCRGMTLQGFLMSEPVSREKLMPLIKTLPALGADLVLRSRSTGRSSLNTAPDESIERTGSFKY
jgi:hypothetical protein